MSISYDTIERALNDCLDGGKNYVTYQYLFDDEGENSKLIEIPCNCDDEGANYYYPKYYYSKSGYFKLVSESEAKVVGIAGVKYMVQNYYYSHDVKVIPGTEPLEAIFDPGCLPK